jgi:hypothetical protein
MTGEQRMRSINGRGRRLMMTAAAVICGLGIAGAAAGTAQAALADAWGFALVQIPSGAAAGMARAAQPPGWSLNCYLPGGAMDPT